MVQRTPNFRPFHELFRRRPDFAAAHKPFVYFSTSHPKERQDNRVNTMLYIWGEVVPNWIMAIAAGGAAIAFVWRYQDKRESRESAREGIVSRVNASWAILKNSNGRDEWGVLVSNSLDTKLTDLRVECVGNTKSKPILRRSMEPGFWFFRSTQDGWAYPDRLTPEEEQSVRYVASGAKKSVDSISFTYLKQDYSHDLS